LEVPTSIHTSCWKYITTIQRGEQVGKNNNGGQFGRP
jgi:hypothetical protein